MYPLQQRGPFMMKSPWASHWIPRQLQACCWAADLHEVSERGKRFLLRGSIYYHGITPAAKEHRSSRFWSKGDRICAKALFLNEARRAPRGSLIAARGGRGRPLRVTVCTVAVGLVESEPWSGLDREGPARQQQLPWTMVTERMWAMIKEATTEHLPSSLWCSRSIFSKFLLIIPYYYNSQTNLNFLFRKCFKKYTSQ